MKTPDIKAFRDRASIEPVLKEIARRASRLPSPFRIMEVCGTHTMALHKYGLARQLAETGLDMISGPGCPVCITPDGYHEAAVKLLSETENLVLASFGDMTRVPTRLGPIRHAVPARGSRLRIVYSPAEALEEARGRPDKEVVFYGAGFETTIPAIARTVEAAGETKTANFSVLGALWLIPPPLRVLLESGETAVQGFLYPGHVSAVIGTGAYDFIPKNHGIPGAVAGFEPGDMVLGILSILDQAISGLPTVANTYARVVRPEGNPRALEIMDRIFEPCDALWRGLGEIPGSGLRFRKTWLAYDAKRKFRLDVRSSADDVSGCRCGDVLRGLLSPPLCPLFGKACSPDSPKGPCMVSYEGACLVHFKFARRKGPSHV